MPIKRTDVGRIQYPKGTSISDRRHCRRMITSVVRSIGVMDHIIISCSGGIDSTVLVHAVGQALRISPFNSGASKIEATAVYLNHNLRPEEIQKEAEHVDRITKEYLSHTTPAIDLEVPKGPGLQERARDARYRELRRLAEKIVCYQHSAFLAVVTAHNANDDVETKLFRFLKAGKAVGIPPFRRFLDFCPRAFLIRPFLSFTREDIERYAKAFCLTWCEDSSNSTDNYTRNKIRHHLIPWIESNINPGLIKMLNAKGESHVGHDP